MALPLARPAVDAAPLAGDGEADAVLWDHVCRSVRAQIDARGTVALSPATTRATTRATSAADRAFLDAYGAARGYALRWPGSPATPLPGWAAPAAVALGFLAGAVVVALGHAGPRPPRVTVRAAP